MEEKIVVVGLQGTRVTKVPDTVVAERQTRPRITWTAVAEPAIERITSIVIGDGWPFDQPSAVSPKVWQVENPNSFRRTFTYEITVETANAELTEDPEIENMGQNGDIDPNG